MEDMSYSKSWAQGYGCYEQLNIIDGINDSESYELTPLDAMNKSGLRMILLVLDPKLMTLNAMKNSELWLMWTTLGHELKLKVVFDMKNLGCEPRGSRCYEELRTVDDMSY